MGVPRSDPVGFRWSNGALTKMSLRLHQTGEPPRRGSVGRLAPLGSGQAAPPPPKKKEWTVADARALAAKREADVEDTVRGQVAAGERMRLEDLDRAARPAFGCGGKEQIRL